MIVDLIVQFYNLIVELVHVLHSLIDDVPSRTMLETVCDACVNKAMNSAIGVMQDHVQSLMEGCTGNVIMLRDNLNSFLKNEGAKAHKARCDLVECRTALSSAVQTLNVARQELVAETKAWKTCRDTMASERPSGAPAVLQSEVSSIILHFRIRSVCDS